ncbi:unnamed protein product [Clonostachys rhizophaga]|uniref:Heme haloperoxidase family profile domain-containing protein n=1 Tax=Clonostachys rhizophaga TaxID=160324 RepID=A0A9N9YVS0_9HYPO|nr:unnamed protein product [Clonostachys rhizophaga]
MKLSTCLITLITAWGTAAQHPHLEEGKWKAPGANDCAPCPMMNTLANHGYIPRDGRNITKPNIIAGLAMGLNFKEPLASLMFDMAIIANPEPNATYFTLDHLNQHNVLEHDASLRLVITASVLLPPRNLLMFASRTDAYFGSNHVFNWTIYEKSKAYWTEPIITAQMLANSKLARQVESRAFNPTYRFTADTENFSLGEIAAPIIAFGDMALGEVNRTLVDYFFVNERLPAELGWHKKEVAIGVEDILKVSDMIKAATSLITGPDHSNSWNKRDLHVGIHT